MNAKNPTQASPDHTTGGGLRLKLREQRLGSLDWQFEAALDGFLQELLPVLENPERLPGAERVKGNRHRSVTRIPVAGRSGHIYLKSFPGDRLTDRLKTLARPSKARGEFVRARQAWELGIPTARPALFGEERRGLTIGRSLMATWEIEGAVNYARLLDTNRALPAAASEARRRADSRAIADLTHQLFEAGFLHGDFHIGNLLMAGNGVLCVIDLDALRSPPILTKAAKLAVLARVCVSHAPFAWDRRPWARQEVHWICERFSELRSDLGQGSALEEAILRGAARIEAVRLRSRDKRCIVDSSDYQPDGSPSRRIYRRRNVTLSDINSATQARGIGTLHRSHRSLVEIIAAPPTMAAAIARIRGGAAPSTLVRKQTWAHRTGALLETLIGPSKGMKSWKAARALEVRGLETALVLAIEERRPGILMTTRSALIMEHLRGTWMVHRYLVEVLGNGRQAGSAAPCQRQRFTRELAEFLLRVQEGGIRHHDLAVQNVLVRPASDDGHDFFLIDLDTVSTKGLRHRDRMRNLIHFADLPSQASRSDKLRFFLHYLTSGGDQIMAEELTKYGRKGLIRELSGRLASRLEAKRRRMERRRRADPHS